MKDVIVIVVSGASGSGKTTLANRLQQYYGDKYAAVLSLDNYYKGICKMQSSSQSELNFDHPDSIDS